MNTISPILFQAAKKKAPIKTEAAPTGQTANTGSPQPEVLTIRQGPGVIYYSPKLNDISVRYTPETKAQLLQSLQQFQPQELTDETSFKLIRFKLPNSANPETVWQKLDEMVASGTVPFVSPALSSPNYPGQTLLLTNLMEVVFKKRPSETKLNSLIQANQLKLVKAIEEDAVYRFEAAPRSWRQTLSMLDGFHDLPGVKIAYPNFVRYMPKPS